MPGLGPSGGEAAILGQVVAAVERRRRNTVVVVVQCKRHAVAERVAQPGQAMRRVIGKGAEGTIWLRYAGCGFRPHRKPQQFVRFRRHRGEPPARAIGARDHETVRIGHLRIKSGASPCGRRPVQIDLDDFGLPAARTCCCTEASGRPGSRKRSRREAVSPPCGSIPDASNPLCARGN